MKNNKLSLNKQIMANLDNLAMGEVKGGGLQTWYGNDCIDEITDFIIETMVKSVQHCFSGDPKGLCKTDICTFICETNGCHGTEVNSCYGGSCGKCG